MKKRRDKKLKTVLDMKLTILVIASVVIMTLVGFIFVVSGKSKVGYGWKKPFVVAALMGDRDMGLPEGEGELASQEDAGYTLEEATASDATEGDAKEKLIKLCEETPGRMNRPMLYEEVDSFEPRSAYYSYTGKKPLTTVYPYVDADEQYYNDTLFIGDSRIEGLYSFGNMEGPDFCFKEGINVFNIFTEALDWGDNGSGKLSELLTTKDYKKIYIMLGVNELGKGYDYEYAVKYNEVLKYIRSVQKDAVIVVMGIMYVTKDYSDQNEVYNNDNINARNSLVAGYINGNDTVYLDVNPAVVDETGALGAAYTNDGIHLSAEYYYLWVDFLNSHALQKDMWE